MTFIHRKLLPCVLAAVLGACAFDPAVTPSFGDDDQSGPNDSGSPDAGQITDTRPGSDAAVPQDVGFPDTGGSDPDLGPEPVDGGPTDPDMRPPAEDMAPPDPTICGGQPVDTTTDPAHCGACNNACDETYGDCEDSNCVCAFGAEPCGPTNTCVDTDHDPLNCGACGSVCDAGEVCLAGDCRCRPGLTRCDGSCVDTESDPSHCGSCGNECGGDVCLDGSCEDRNFCPIGKWTCEAPGGRACIDGQESDLYCDPGLQNTCGTQCAGNEFCYDPGPFAGPECVVYRTGIGCTDCPCMDCGPMEACVKSDDVPDVAYCITR